MFLTFRGSSLNAFPACWENDPSKQPDMSTDNSNSFSDRRYLPRGINFLTVRYLGQFFKRKGDSFSYWLPQQSDHIIFFHVSSSSYSSSYSFSYSSSYSYSLFIASKLQKNIRGTQAKYFMLLVFFFLKNKYIKISSIIRTDTFRATSTRLENLRKMLIH